MSAEMTKKPGGSMKKGLIGGAAVIAVGLIAWSLIDYPPKNSEVEGTIGTADKYRVEQINQGDVKLDNSEIHALIQNDAVMAMLKDPDFRRAAQSEAFRNWVATDLFRTEVGSAGWARLAADVNLRAAAPAAFSLMGDEQNRAYFANTEYARAWTTVEFQKIIGTPDVARAATPDALRAALAQPDVMRLANTDALKAALADPNFERMILTPNYREILVSQSFLKILGNDELRRACTNIEFSRMLGNETYSRAILAPEFQRFMILPNMRAALASVDFWKSAIPEAF